MWGGWLNCTSEPEQPCEPRSHLEAHKTCMRQSFYYYPLRRNSWAKKRRNVRTGTHFCVPKKRTSTLEDSTYLLFPFLWPRFSARPDLERSLKNKKRIMYGSREVLPGAGCSLVRIKRFCSWLNLRPTCALAQVQGAKPNFYALLAPLVFHVGISIFHFRRAFSSHARWEN
jgi:hypothetical protein